jgi:hypothetical protein
MGLEYPHRFAKNAENNLFFDPYSDTTKMAMNFVATYYK